MNTICKLILVIYIIKLTSESIPRPTVNPHQRPYTPNRGRVKKVKYTPKER